MGINSHITEKNGKAMRKKNDRGSKIMKTKSYTMRDAFTFLGSKRDKRQVIAHYL